MSFFQIENGALSSFSLSKTDGPTSSKMGQPINQLSEMQFILNVYK